MNSKNQNDLDESPELRTINLRTRLAAAEVIKKATREICAMYGEREAAQFEKIRKIVAVAAQNTRAALEEYLEAAQREDAERLSDPQFIRSFIEKEIARDPVFRAELSLAVNAPLREERERCAKLVEQSFPEAAQMIRGLTPRSS